MGVGRRQRDTGGGKRMGWYLYDKLNIWPGEKVRSYRSNKKNPTKQYQKEEFIIKNYLNLYHLLTFLTDWPSKSHFRMTLEWPLDYVHRLKWIKAKTMKNKRQFHNDIFCWSHIHSNCKLHLVKNKFIH